MDAQPGWDMHDHGADIADARGMHHPAGASVSGHVVCHHHYGLGVQLDGGDFGHVNVTEIGAGPTRGPVDFPPIGSEVVGAVLGYSGSEEQLRLTLRSTVIT